LSSEGVAPIVYNRYKERAAPLIDDLEARLAQKTERENLFTILWRVI